jgi:hypothetical protein
MFVRCGRIAIQDLPAALDATEPSVAPVIFSAR